MTEAWWQESEDGSRAICAWCAGERLSCHGCEFLSKRAGCFRGAGGDDNFLEREIFDFDVDGARSSQQAAKHQSGSKLPALQSTLMRLKRFAAATFILGLLWRSRWR